MRDINRAAKALPVVASVALLLTACGSNGNGEAPIAAQQPAPAAAAAAPATVPGVEAQAPAAEARTAKAAKAESTKSETKTKKATAKVAAPAKAVDNGATQVKKTETAAQDAENQKIYDQKNGHGHRRHEDRDQARLDQHARHGAGQRSDGASGPR